MYVTTTILMEKDRHLNSEYPQAYHMHHKSMTELKDWVVFNHMVLGEPYPRSPYFSVVHKDGSALSEAEMNRLHEVASEAAFIARGKIIYRKG